ncbi:acyltransferase family protein [Secundilactobacillus kimchicus]|uniref:acyltransferase family protein n=1 Tax=Secundilactobacillus kimchicus TaxID=528209 RepID=UPI0024A7B80C|nr:acyltransferase family protein [Secundilactobacillus kimchicus]
MQRSGEKRLRNSRYITGFDGIRTIAVLGVIIYHLLPYNLQGGYLGVPIFFVVSGYLITDLLLQEYEQNGRIDILGFYERRMKRLYPALVTMVLATAAYITLFERSLFVNLKSIIWTNMLYVYNWWEIGHGSSYFDRFNGESPFTHLWSLSIEGQYYAFWPVILVLLLMIFKQRKTFFYLLFGLAAASAAWMAFLFKSVDDTNRVYYGTDTRMFAILLGVGLAFAWPATKLRSDIEDGPRRMLNGVGLVSLLAVVIMFFTMSGQSTFTYHGGMFLFTVVSTVLVATVAHPAGIMNKIFSNPVFDWVGKRSYGIYLYQFPVMIFFEAKVTNAADHPVLYPLIEAAIILLISDLSYRYLERPLRRYHYSELPGAIRDAFSRNSRFGWKRLVAIPAVLVIMIALYGAATAPNKLPAQATALQNHIEKNQKQADKQNAQALKKQKAAEKRLKQEKDQKDAVKKAKLTRRERFVMRSYGLTKAQVVMARDTPVTAIGDSVMVDVSTDLQQVFPNAYVSAQVGRQIWQAPGVIKQLIAKGALANTVLINLGTNSPMTNDQINDVMKLIGTKRQVFWINTHVPTRNWESQVNATINRASKRYKNLTVVDWHDLSQNSPSWFYGDHVHPNPTGNKQFAKLVAQAVLKAN